MEDLRDLYPHLVDKVCISIVEAGKEILGSFDEKLRQYATDAFRRQRIRILTESPVIEVGATSITLADGATLEYGLLLWTTGNGPTPFALGLSLETDGRGRIVVDEFFHAKGSENVYAIGDCSVGEQAPLPATAQVAQQQGKYLAQSLNKLATGRDVEPFKYKHLGMLAYIGNNRALADLEGFKGRGWAAWLFWRSTYLSRIVSLRNKFSVLMDWIRARLFGRDTSQF
jgi:NADH:ubiquinone reductase (non-electrogenic)